MKTSSEGGSTDLSLLTMDYQAARDDQRSLQQTLAGVMSLAILLIPALGAYIGRSCGQGKGLLSCPKHKGSPIFAFLPLSFVAILSFVALLGTLASLRTYYIRDLELQIAEASGADLSPESRTSRGRPHPAPSMEHLLAALNSHL
jgi:hypothetical protein